MAFFSFTARKIKSNYQGNYQIERRQASRMREHFFRYDHRTVDGYCPPILARHPDGAHEFSMGYAIFRSFRNPYIGYF
jgi:hypothetical protein